MSGRCVKGRQFSNHRDVGSPVSVAKVFEAQGADELIFLNIGGGDVLDIVRDVAAECFMPLTVGGGIRTLEDIRALLMAGADKVSINTATELIPTAAKEFGSQAIVCSIDYLNNPVERAEEAEVSGAGEILLTSILHEGMGEGYDLETLRLVSQAVDIPVIAHGGVGSLEHFVEGIEAGASAVAAGTIFHFSDQGIIKAHSYMQQAGLKVRPW